MQDFFDYYCQRINKYNSQLMLKSTSLLLIMVSLTLTGITQNNPVISSWLQNTTVKGRHYMKGNSTPITDNTIANVQKVQYSANSVYINTQGIPAYITGPFLDGNPSLATNQNGIFKFPLKPQKNNGTPSPTTGGNIGLFINGVALFDYRDAVSWQNSTQTLKGGPFGGMGDQVWNRDAVVAERIGFDCSKGHPAMGNYHHHQNPSAFNLDRMVISTVCDLYAADGLYVIDSTKHSPLIGFAYDGFPIYGAYAYKNADGTGGITRMKSSFVLRDIKTRTTYANGNTVTPGPDVSSKFPLGYFREDYVYVPASAAKPDYLDEHNGRWCITPDFPNGTYAYFCTVDDNWNSYYPYCVGPTFYGVKNAMKVQSINEPTTVYSKGTASKNALSEDLNIVVYPNPASDLIAVQLGNAAPQDYILNLFDLQGRLVASSTLYQGSTISFIDTRTFYEGQYMLQVSCEQSRWTKKVEIVK